MPKIEKRLVTLFTLKYRSRDAEILASDFNKTQNRKT